MDGLFSSDIIAALSGGRRPPAPKDYRLPTQFPAFNRAKRVCVDIESYDPDINERGPGWRRDAYIVGVAVAIQDRSDEISFTEYYPTAHKGVQNLSADKVTGWLSTELAFFTGDLVGTNLLYDGDALQYQNVEAPLAKWRDIQWCEALLDENALSYKLNLLASKYLNEHKATDELRLKYGDHYIRRFMEVHPGHAKSYGLSDVTLPIRILDEQLKQLRKEKMEALYDLECRLTPMLLYMRRLGVRVDLAKAAGLHISLGAKRDEALREASKLCSVDLTVDNFTKPSVVESVFRNIKIQIPRIVDGKIYTPGMPEYDPRMGRPSIRDVWLDNLDHPIGELLQTAHKCEKAKTTFVDGYITDNAIGDRVHCEFHPLRKKKEEGDKSKGTVSGRFSGSNPNLQNIPVRDEEIGPLCRSMFTADEGCKWWSQDFSQIEYRFLVHFAVALGCIGADVPQKMYRDNPKTDFHDACASLMYEKEWKEAEARDDKKALKQLRKPAKNLNFGMVYGQGVALLAAILNEVNPDGTPNDNAKRIMNEYHTAAPYIRDLNKKCVKFTEEHGWMDTIMGRRRRFELYEQRFTEKGQPRIILPKDQALAKWGNKIKPTGTHKALNVKLQGSAADLMKIAMVLLWESGLFDPSNDITCVLTVHDELNGSFVPSTRGLAALKEVKNIMENAWKLWSGEELNIPVLTSGSTGANWAEAK